MSTRFYLLGTAAIATSAIVACYTGGDVTPWNTSSTAPGGSTSRAPTTSTEGTSTDSAMFAGLPCDVATVLAKDCAMCHGTKPSGGAPNSMMTYEDLKAPSTTNPSSTIAEMSVLRMKDTKNPMPPDGAPAEDLAVVATWIQSGMPKSNDACDAKPAPSVYDTPSACTSGTRWTRGDRGSNLMRPGGACIECHEQEEDDAPFYYAAGTVYPTAHEPNDCNGVSGSAQVVITDANGKTYTASVNGAGNFYFDRRSPIQTPYKAKVVAGGKSRAMSSEQTDGDCNKCHTESGSAKEKTPGRIMAP